MDVQVTAEPLPPPEHEYVVVPVLISEVVEPDESVALNSCLGGDWARVIVDVEPPLVEV